MLWPTNGDDKMRELLQAYKALSEAVSVAAMEIYIHEGPIEELNITIQDLDRLRLASGDMAMRCKNLIEKLKYGVEE